MAVALDGMTGGQPVGLTSPGRHFPSREEISIHFMAQRIQTLLIDDLDGGEAAGTVRFGLDGADTRSTSAPRTTTSSVRNSSST
jgi:hypothetical protein